MAEDHKKVVLTVKQQFALLEKFENGELVTELAEDYGIGIDCVHETMLLG
jgi:hypothetical protein